MLNVTECIFYAFTVTSSVTFLSDFISFFSMSVELVFNSGLFQGWISAVPKRMKMTFVKLYIPAASKKTVRQAANVCCK